MNYPNISAGMVVTLRMFHKELKRVRKEEPVLTRGINVVRKLGFADIIMPGNFHFLTIQLYYLNLKFLWSSEELSLKYISSP